jgi:hypothetical protein
MRGSGVRVPSAPPRPVRIRPLAVLNAAEKPAGAPGPRCQPRWRRPVSGRCGDTRHQGSVRAGWGRSPGEYFPSVETCGWPLHASGGRGDDASVAGISWSCNVPPTRWAPAPIDLPAWSRLWPARWLKSATPRCASVTPPVDISTGALHRPGLPRFLTSGHAHWQQQSRHEHPSASSSHCESSQRRHTMPIPP